MFRIVGWVTTDASAASGPVFFKLMPEVRELKKMNAKRKPDVVFSGREPEARAPARKPKRERQELGPKDMFGEQEAYEAQAGSSQSSSNLEWMEEHHVQRWRLPMQG